MEDQYDAIAKSVVDFIRTQLERNLPWEKDFMVFCWERGVDFNTDEERIFKKARHEIKFRSEKSDEIRRRVPCQLQIPYGETEREKFDLFGAHSLPDDSPILILVHGGGFISGCREQYSFVANKFYEQSIVTAVIGYDLAPKVTLHQMIDEVRRGVKAIQEYVQPKRRIFLSGISAGAHLISSAIIIGSSDEAPLIDGLILIAGVYNFTPFQPSCIMKSAKIDEKTALHFSLCEKSPELVSNRLKMRCPSGVLLTVGEWDTPGLRTRQYTKMKELLMQADVPVRCKIIPEIDHIDITMSLYYDSVLTREIVSFVKGKTIID